MLGEAQWIERQPDRPRHRRRRMLAPLGHGERPEDRLRAAAAVGVGQRLRDHAGIGGDVVRIGEGDHREPRRDVGDVGAGARRVLGAHRGIGAVVVEREALAPQEAARAVGEARVAIDPQVVGLRAVRLGIALLPIVEAVALEAVAGRVGDVPFAEIMRRIARLPHPGAERRDAVGLEPGEIGRIAVLEQPVGLGDAGPGAVLAGVDHRAAGGAGAGGDRVVAQHHRIVAQLEQAGEELGIGIRFADGPLEAEDLLQRLVEAMVGTIGEAREAILIAGDEQDVRARARIAIAVRHGFLLKSSGKIAEMKRNESVTIAMALATILARFYPFFSGDSSY